MRQSTRFEYPHRRQVCLIMLALAILGTGLAWGQETLVVDQSDNRGWLFLARPEISVPGEAPIRGIADHAGGNASLNFSTTLGNQSSRSATLRQSDFPSSMSDIETFNDLTSMSWRVNHSSTGGYPKLPFGRIGKTAAVHSVRRFTSAPRVWPLPPTNGIRLSSTSTRPNLKITE